jgi:uncharacterized iron-regulated protein
MLLAWLLATASAAEPTPTCVYVGFDDITSKPAPEVIVLGERHGFAKDLGRAMKVARRLATEGPVTIALESVHRKNQPVLDAFAAGKVDAADLPDELDWKHTWGFAFAPYRSLVMASEEGMKVLGIGLDLGPKPDDAQFPIPPRYIDLLRPAMGDHDVPLRQEARFVASMAWRDHALAKAALDGWDGKGHLLIVAGRGHVEGGKGVAWQAAHLTEAPVDAYVLVPGPHPPCHEGDRLWR